MSFKLHVGHVKGPAPKLLQPQVRKATHVPDPHLLTFTCAWLRNSSHIKTTAPPPPHPQKPKTSKKAEDTLFFQPARRLPIGYVSRTKNERLKPRFLGPRCNTSHLSIRSRAPPPELYCRFAHSLTCICPFNCRQPTIRRWAGGNKCRRDGKRKMQ